MKEYSSRYEEHSSHGSAMRLLARSGCDRGAILDLGCGRSPLAEVAAEAGFDYVGLDIDDHALADLDERGFEVHRIDLAAPDLVDQLQAVAGDRKVSAVLLLDVLEHVVDPGAVLRQVGSLFTGLGLAGGQLVVSIPNVTHFDLGAKLLAGRWDYVDIGLLDDTHVRFFDDWGYSSLFASNGWREADREDVEFEYSEQRFPADAPFVRPGVPIREFLLGIRKLAEPHALTYQFVGRFQLDSTVSAPARREPDSPKREVFASVVVDVPSGGDATSLFGDLRRQTSGSFEVVVAASGQDTVIDEPDLVSRLGDRCAGVRAVVGLTPAERLRAALDGARGRYTCLVTADTRVGPSWIERLAEAEAGQPGSVLVAGAASLPGAAPSPDRAGLRSESGPAFFEELIELGAQPLVQSWIELLSVEEPGHVVPQSFAIPTDALVTTTIDLTSERPGGTAAALLRAVELCGLAHSSGICVAVPRARVFDGAHQLSLGRGELSAQPFLLPSGSFSAILDLRGELRRERRERSHADTTARAAEANAHALAAQVERLDQELHAARIATLEAERRGVVGRLVRIAQRVLRS